MKFIQKEVFTIKYWLHIGLVSFLVLGFLQLIFHGEMLTVKNVLLSIPLIGVADVITHSVFASIGYPT